MDASKSDTESTGAALKEWLGETKKPKKDPKTAAKTETGEQKKKKGKTTDEMSDTKTTIKRKLVDEQPNEFSPAPAVVDARVNLVKAQIISEVEDAVEKIRKVEQDKAAKVRKTDIPIEEELQLSDEEEEEAEIPMCPNGEEYALQECEAQKHSVYNVHGSNVPLITIYVSHGTY
ncbi:MAG: hypothetical protein GY737_09240 [Desulfobacteraceae bacterium]|nr:hypothetical protein [Desulfobacteraceae bacterium]